MASPRPVFLAAWRRTLPLRWHGLVVPYGRALLLLLAAYAGATALLRPWALGMWWALGVPLALSLLLVWWLWRRWALLARSDRGDWRGLPLMLTWFLVIVACNSLREYLHARLGEVREVYRAADLAQPGAAVFFFLRGPFYAAKIHHGRYISTSFIKSKNGNRAYYATYAYACPLLASPADMATTPRAWLGYFFNQNLGNNLVTSEVEQISRDFGRRADARLDSANLADFTYLQRPEDPSPDLLQAVRASRLGTSAAPLLLLPVRESFTVRGQHAWRLALGVTFWGSVVVVGLLLVVPLRLEYS
ncbi:MAG: hypothetical protein ACRYF0_11955 [Janthinobacterium lividum]